jgi:methylmalonyl-CoA mutase N-terminal domain/subunit
MRDRFGARDPRSWTLRLFSGGDGTTLTGTEPLNNVVRTTLQTLAIVLSGAQAVHTMSWDEALALPTQEAALLALRTQQIVAYESGATRTVDPLGGSYYLESLTDELERRAGALLEDVERDGVVRGIADGSLELAIADAAFRQQEQIESGERVVVGVNRFASDEADVQDVEVLTVPEEVRDRQLARLAGVKAARDEEQVRAALAQVSAAARSDGSTMPAVIAAVRAYGTVGEISAALGEVFGYHRASTVV